MDVPRILWARFPNSETISPFDLHLEVPRLSCDEPFRVGRPKRHRTTRAVQIVLIGFQVHKVSFLIYHFSSYTHPLTVASEK